VCVYNISPHFKSITNTKNGINVVLYLFIIIKNISKEHTLSMKYIILFSTLRKFMQSIKII